MSTVMGTLRTLPPESRMTGGAAVALVLSLLLPWYQVTTNADADSRSALQFFTWVEGAILLVAAAVLYLVWARSQRRAFHLPGGDGFVVSLAGGWALALLVWRLFDKPSITGAGTTVGIDWGIFVAVLAAGALVAAGAQVRAAGRPEPPNPTAEEPVWEVPGRERRERARPREHTEVTQVLSERPPRWDGEPPEAPGGRRRAPPPPAPPEPPPAPPDRLF